jgi:hypothetical protein
MREPVPDFDDFGEIPWPLDALKTGDLKSALAGYATRHMLEYRTGMQGYADDDLSGFGAVLWLMGDRLGAANVWFYATNEAIRGRFKYSNSGTFRPGLLLWFASVWLKDEDWHDEATALLDKLSRKEPSSGGRFISQLAKLLRHEIDLEDVRVEYAGMSPHDRDNAECQALFYAGVRAHEEGNVEEVRRLWQQVPTPPDEGELEYYLLVQEREKLSR